ncbi:hypothetical protein COJ38_01980 [Bacillus cereus]|uniref:AAA family ATPase n=1 Tax=Bacillus cereus group TaxID=86661 RepID=UPI000872AA9A|nr:MULTISPECIES: AAA family ATPase [Bacillus cereus group]OFD42212.1 hypothetical protein BWGOE3_34650 [Bacillus mycoides]PET48522.1 hypothetical protein CN521_20825 [Bacillus cereus]PFA79716.1 hypothetical protein CN400_26720 [Bacillus thuringiensis]PFB47566.1 hypothetical protein CN413_02800 [Bacillus cereus]PFE93437.1 hypothetical protein CN321_11645 [Bacillus thuringiensis]
MRINRVYIQKYKSLKEFKIIFNEYDSQIYKVPCRFLIGQNGSGKSIFLEAIGLIFTRIMQDESPGFNYEIEYTVFVDGSYKTVRLSSKNKKKAYWIDNIPYNWDNEPFSQKVDYHPEKIIAQSTGPTNNLNEVLLKTPEDSLISDIYDITHVDADPENNSTIQSIIQKIEHLYEDPNCIYIDGETAILVIITLCAFSRLTDNPSSNQEYCQKRKELFNIIGQFLPISFSITVTEKDILERVGSEKGSIEREFLKLLYTEEEIDSPILYDYKNISLNSDSQTISENEEGSFCRTVTFRLTKDTTYNTFNYFHEKINNRTNPFAFLSSLLYAKRVGLLKNIDMAFKMKNSGVILNKNSFSDGEYLWLARLGLLLLGRYKDNILYLFDEPDVHSNEAWNINFIHYINEFTCPSKVHSALHEVIVATHSTLLLTDADSDQIYHFISKNGKISKTSRVSLSTFGANRGEIDKQIFGTNSTIGTHSEKLIEQAFQLADEKKDTSLLEKLGSKMGPGYHYFRIANRLLEIESKE